METVSYTHLDVYKRQQLTEKIGDTNIRIDTLENNFIPVSYTHLHLLGK